MIGQAVGNYRIGALLGQGGMGAVYVAAHPGLGRRAAVKILHKELAEDEQIVRRFFNEARAANAINHPGIVQVFDVGRLDSGACYIVMEFLEGESLGARLRRQRRLELPVAIDIAVQATEALAAAHAKGIVHRDLKPDNLFLVPDPRTPGHSLVKVLDFGIAKLVDGALGERQVRTRTGVMLGTPVYMSPEQCRGVATTDLRADIYSLGVILFEMLCGAPPFFSSGIGELIHMHIGEPPPRPRTLNAAIPEETEAVILRALAKEPASRFSSMQELGELLGRRSGSTLPLSPGRPALPATVRLEPPAPSSTTLGSGAVSVERELARPRRGLAIALGVLALAGAVGVTVMRSRMAHVRVPAAVPAAPPAQPPKEPPPAPEPPPAKPATAETQELPPPRAIRPAHPRPSHARPTAKPRTPASPPPVERPHEPVPL